jgi:uncharacterized protein (DUF302 family)
MIRRPLASAPAARATLVACAALALLAPACAPAPDRDTTDSPASATGEDAADGLRAGSGLVTVSSPASVAITFDRLRAAIEANENLTVLATVDHAANADRVGLALPPTRLILFGNPRLGTPLMRDGRTLAIDLPQKLLVWQTDDGATRVTWNDPAFLARRHGVRGHEDTLRTIAEALRRLASGATATGDHGVPAGDSTPGGVQ